MVPRPFGQGCPETPLLLGLQVTDSVSPEFSVLVAHEETFSERLSANGPLFPVQDDEGIKDG